MNGAAMSELDAIAQQIVEVEYRNNPLTLQRMLILKQLEPYPHKTLSELLELQQRGLIDTDLLRLKVNFSSLIDRFERENINIIEFASNKTLREKINIINKKLMQYVREIDRTNSQGNGNGEPN